MNLNDLSKQIYEANKAKGFWDSKRNEGEMLMLIVSELGEAMEALRKDKIAPNVQGEIFEPTQFESIIKDTFQDEVADALIRILDMCGGMSIDIDYHVTAKLRYNATRERFHGKKF